jgi:hypothetical protein
MLVAFISSSVVGANAALSLLVSFAIRIPVCASLSVLLYFFSIASSSIRLLPIKILFVSLALVTLLLALQLFLREKLASLFVPEQHGIIYFNLPFAALCSLTPCSYFLCYGCILFRSNPQ